MKTDWRR